MYADCNQTLTLLHLQDTMYKADHKVNDVFKQLLTDIVKPVLRGQFGESPTDRLIQYRLTVKYRFDKSKS